MSMHPKQQGEAADEKLPGCRMLSIVFLVSRATHPLISRRAGSAPALKSVTFTLAWYWPRASSRNSGRNAKFFGRDAGSEIKEDLERLKNLLETGEVPDEGASTAWPQHTAEVAWNAAVQAKTYFYENPWALVGSAAAIGLVVGLIIGGPRRRSKMCQED